jgi:acetylornithine aminotransferase
MEQATHLMQTYGRLPVAFASGEGAWLTDTEGKRYLDAMAGVAVCSLGHAHPAVADAVCQQARTLVHTSNWYRISKQEQLGERLCVLAGMERAFFGNSGAEANEAAIKLARLHGHNKGIDTPAIIVTEHSFHGRTLATLTASGSRKIQAGFEPLVQGFVRVPYNDLDAVRQVAANTRNVVAMLLEPIIGEGGVMVPSAGYLRGLREICDANGWLLILDEIQTGMGRTGKWFAFQHEEIAPDVITVAKALGNGVPIGACLARGEAADVLSAGKHGSTFGGNPLACAAALAVIETMEAGDLLARAAQLGNRMLDGLRQGLDGVAGVVRIQGKGLMLGIELDRECGPLMTQALGQGLLINVTALKTVRLLPPMILTDAEADQIVAGVVDLIQSFTAA